MTDHIIAETRAVSCFFVGPAQTPEERETDHVRIMNSIETIRQEVETEMEKYAETWVDVVKVACPRNVETSWMSPRGENVNGVGRYANDEPEYDEDNSRASSHVPFTIWTANRVYFPLTYDGWDSVGSAPRQPSDEALVVRGGG